MPPIRSIRSDRIAPIEPIGYYDSLTARKENRRQAQTFLSISLMSSALNIQWWIRFYKPKRKEILTEKTNGKSSSEMLDLK